MKIIFFYTKKQKKYSGTLLTNCQLLNFIFCCLKSCLYIFLMRIHLKFYPIKLVHEKISSNEINLLLDERLSVFFKVDKRLCCCVLF